jgi:hypothetical protein
MQSIRYLSLPIGLVALLGIAPAADAFTEVAGASLEFPLAYEASPLDLPSVRLEEAAFGGSADLGAGWIAQSNPRTGTLHLAYGGNLFLANGIGSETQAIELARGFLLQHGDALGTFGHNMTLANVFEYRGKYAVRFRQEVQDVPVHNASAFVLLASSGRVVAFGSDFFPERHGVVLNRALSEAEAIDAATRALGATPRIDRPAGAELVLVPAPAGALLELAATYEVTFEAEEPFGKWVTFVHAGTGEILGRRNLYHFVDVVGNVDGSVEDFGYCDGEAAQALEKLTVNVQGGNSDVTDANGDYVISHGGAGSVTVTAELRGPFINVNYVAGPDASFSGTATPGVPFSITWDGSDARYDERDVFFHGNRIHGFMKNIDSGFTGLDYSVPSSVGNTGGICPGNAWWDGTGMNFCAQGGSFANIGRIGNVVYHEYGHGISQRWYQANGSSLPGGDMHEGNADVVANFIDRNPIVGIGFFQGNCSGGIRNADNDLQWPDDNNGGHSGGQIIAGFHWDAWQALLSVMPQAEADEIAFDTWHFGRGMGTPQNQADQVFWTFVADDNDGDLTNGTPNYDEFCLGAVNHGFECPIRTFGIDITHAKLGHTEDGSQGFDVVATIVATEGALDPSSLTVSWRRNGPGGAYDVLPMTPTANPDEYVAHIPAQNDQFSEIDYFVTAADLAGNEAHDPVAAPLEAHSFDVAFQYETLESGGAGWTAGLPGDNATTGQWELADPIGTAAQPEDDATPAPGVLAFITGQCDGPNCSGGCDLECNDVDGGRTTLLSPVYDLAGAVEAKIKYDRWYSNDTGSSPGELWIVKVSNDAGANWTTVEHTSEADASWSSRGVDLNALFGAPNQVQLRFEARDFLGDTIVEAGVDDIRILASFGATGSPDVATASTTEFALSQNEPNPFGPATRIEFALPNRSEVELTIYNVQGQAVRNLARGVRNAGRHRVSWDGRDSGGRFVGGGVYFYRLQSDAGVITRKMTYMK